MDAVLLNTGFLTADAILRRDQTTFRGTGLGFSIQAIAALAIGPRQDRLSKKQHRSQGDGS